MQIFVKCEKSGVYILHEAQKETYIRKKEALSVDVRKILNHRLYGVYRGNDYAKLQL